MQKPSAFSPNEPADLIFSLSAVYEADGHKFLIKQLRGRNKETVANSVATLCNMAEQEVTRHSILSHGAIQALAETLKSTNTQVLLSTTQCLALLACDMDARAEVGVSVCVRNDQILFYSFL